jgi:hypothetical protein
MGFPYLYLIQYKSLRQNRMSFLSGKWLTQVPEAALQVFPDAVFWGTGFLALVTLSYPFGVFFVSLIEATILYHGLNYGNENLQIISPNHLSSGKCRTGFADVSLRAISIFEREFKPVFLSSSIFMVSFISSYLLGVVLYLKDSLQILGSAYGEQYTTRLYASTAFFAFLIFITMSYRLLNHCDSAINIIISLFFGLGIGALITVQNNSILGVESLNLLGVPILRKRTADGGDLYVCSPT